MAMNWEEKYNEARNQAERISALGSIYDKLVDSMQWDCMEYHSADEEHESSWFTDYPEDHWQYENASAKKAVYEEVLAAIEKLAK